MPHLRVVGIILAAGLFSRDVSARPPREANQDAIVVRECLVVDSVGRRGRSAFRADAIEAQFVAGTWRAPRAGDTVTLPDGQTRSWRPATADAAGWFEGRAFDGGYACAVARSDSDKAMLLHAQGHSMARVNGAPRAGDPYSTGYVLTPIQLHKGDNVLLFRCGRGKLRIELLEPDAPALLNAKDATLPDLVVGQAVDQWAAVVAINATDSPLEGLAIHASFGNDRRSTTTPIPPLLPHGVRKAAFRISGTAPRETGDLVLRLELLRNADRAGEALDSTTATLHVRSPEKARKRTFFSGIDGSLQYYAELPPWPPASDAARPPALFLSLHGAAVEAIRQAGSYSNKSWGWLVAPTNRRPYGFDWEDWGRLDALQVLDTAIRGLGVDPTRVYLTGHSMGGHGAWHLGVTFPDRFAAVGPSAGWISMFSYARMAREPASSPVQDILARCMLPSDTEALARNLAPLGVYILHGQDDDNVPVREARRMSQVLAGFHKDWIFHEQPGVKHWWSIKGNSGAACVDWPPMFDFFARHRLPAPEEIREVDFTTASPGVSARCRWLTIEDQIRRNALSSASIRRNPVARRLDGTTSNVACLALDLAPLAPGEPVAARLDEQDLEIPWPDTGSRVWLARASGQWAVAPRPSPAMKGPHRYGPFKQAFNERFLFVYGTKGSPEENEWALGKARYDAETFWVQGNGSVDVVADTAFDPSREPDRGVILYGNSQTNAAWSALLGDSPVQVGSRSVRIGEREIEGDDVGCLFLRPRPHTDRACVGVVAGTGLKGMRLTDSLPYFAAGVEYPDCVAFDSSVLARGVEGVRAAGFFGGDWGVDSGEFAFSE